MDNYSRAFELKEEIVKHRRVLHQIAEVGMNLPKTVEYVKNELRKMGYDPIDVGQSGVSATVGQGEKTMLIRADMDALPVTEQSGLPFAATNGTCHACGHDIHTSILLGAAKMLKEQENELKGTVKLMFQPGEEVMHGAADMMKAGILENPKVDCAMALHVRSTDEKGISYTPGVRYASCNNFLIKVKGAAAHGAMPYNGADPIMMAANIIMAMQELVSREVPFNESAVLTIGQFQAGNTFNSIPAEVEIKGTMRSFSNKTREFLKKRLPELINDIAKAYRGTAELEWACDVPVMENDAELTEMCVSTIKKLAEGRFKVYELGPSTGSEDFAEVSNVVPTFMFGLGLPDPDSEIRYNLHNPKIVFDEEFIPAGAAVFVECAVKWLEENS